MIFSLGGSVTTSFAFPVDMMASALEWVSTRDCDAPACPANSSVSSTVLMPCASILEQFIMRSASGLPNPSLETITPSGFREAIRSAAIVDDCCLSDRVTFSFVMTQPTKFHCFPCPRRSSRMMGLFWWWYVVFLSHADTQFPETMAPKSTSDGTIILGSIFLASNPQ